MKTSIFQKTCNALINHNKSRKTGNFRRQKYWLRVYNKLCKKQGVSDENGIYFRKRK